MSFEVEMIVILVRWINVHNKILPNFEKNLKQSILSSQFQYTALNFNYLRHILAGER